MTKAVAKIISDHTEESSVLGTAFAISRRTALTAFHCVGDIATGQVNAPTVSLQFLDGQVLPAQFTNGDPTLDFAILTLLELLPPDLDPIHLGRETHPHSLFRSIGYPEVPGVDVPTVHGSVVNPAATIFDGTPAIQLFCREATTGMSLHGLSGAPVLVGNPEEAIGVIRWNPESDDRESAIGGMVFACPSHCIIDRYPDGVPSDEADDRSAGAIAIRSLLPDSPFDADWYISRPAIENRVLDSIFGSRRPAVLISSNKYGKTWFLRWLMDQLASGDYAKTCQTIFLDFGLISPDARSQKNLLFKEIAEQITTWLELPYTLIDEAWNEPGTPMGHLNSLIEERVLQLASGLNIFLIDRVDAMLGAPTQDDLVSVLRYWDSTKRGVWNNLRFVVASSTTPAQWTGNERLSPFNISIPISMMVDLSGEDISAMAHRVGLSWTNDDVAFLSQYVGGHPYLVSIAVYECSSNGRNVRDLFSDVTAASSVFADHMRSVDNFIRKDPSQLKALCEIVQGRVPVTDNNVEIRLLRSGLIADDGRSYRIRYRLYDEYLRRRTCMMKS